MLQIETTARLKHREEEANQNLLSFNPDPHSVCVCKTSTVKSDCSCKAIAGSKGQTIPNTGMTAGVGS